VNGVTSKRLLSSDVCACVCLRRADLSIRTVLALNANISNTVKATYFKFGVHVTNDNSPDTTSQNLSKELAWRESRDPYLFGLSLCATDEKYNQNCSIVEIFPKWPICTCTS